MSSLMLQECAVVPFETLQPSLFEAEQAINGAIQKVPVVGDNNHATAKVLQEILQNTQGLHVEVVGGFIQQQHIGSLDQHSAEGEPAALSAGELGQRAVLLSRWEEEAFQQL